MFLLRISASGIFNECSDPDGQVADRFPKLLLSLYFLCFFPFPSLSLFPVFPSGDLGSLGQGSMSIYTRFDTLDLSRRTDLHLSVGKLDSFCWTLVLWTLNFRCWSLRPSQEINKGRCSGNFVWSLISFISEGRSAELFRWGIVAVVDLRGEKVRFVPWCCCLIAGL